MSHLLNMYKFAKKQKIPRHRETGHHRKREGSARWCGQPVLGCVKSYLLRTRIIKCAWFPYSTPLRKFVLPYAVNCERCLRKILIVSALSKNWAWKNCSLLCAQVVSLPCCVRPTSPAIHKGCSGTSFSDLPQCSKEYGIVCYIILILLLLLLFFCESWLLKVRFSVGLCQKHPHHSLQNICLWACEYSPNSTFIVL